MSYTGEIVVNCSNERYNIMATKKAAPKKAPVKKAPAKKAPVKKAAAKAAPKKAAKAAAANPAPGEKGHASNSRMSLSSFMGA